VNDGDLRLGGDANAGAPGDGADERELIVRTARKDGKQVVTMRSVARAGECVVECEVYPVSGLTVDPLRPGPYRFESEQEAARFLDEAAQALTYLGCEVSS
jgi:hypothetical protein